MTSRGITARLFLGFVLWAVFAPRAFGVLTFYYDPATGNVAFDTSDTPTGSLSAYQFSRGDGGFREENHIRISDVVIFSSEDDWISDRARDGEYLSGYFSIGDIFPVGLDEATWYSSFLNGIESYHSDVHDRSNAFQSNEPFAYVYGQPDRPYDNHWDLVDPDTLRWATEAVLRYRPSSGEVILDTDGPNGGYISAYYVESDGRFLPGGYTPPFDVPLSSADEDQLVAMAGFPMEPGNHSLGTILEAGLSITEFEDVFTAARFLERAGFAGGSFDLDLHGRMFTLAYEPVPEPAGNAALAFLLFATTWWRSRGDCGGGAFLVSRNQKVL